MIGQETAASRDRRPVLVIPAFKPSAVLPAIIREVFASGAVQKAIVVNDASGSESDAVFQEAAAIDGTEIISHAENLGQGAAVKSGAAFAAENYPECAGIVTADADGQHSSADIIKVAREMTDNPGVLILGVRNVAEMPLRSRFGNSLTGHILHMLTGHRISDTQTGLRGVPMSFIPALLATRSNRYEFALDLLLNCFESRQQIREVGIRTIYEDGNKTSHFRPVLDSMKIYFIFARFVSVSLLSALIDNVVFVIVYHMSSNILGSQATSRASAIVFNYFANRQAVFHSNARVRKTMPRYLLLAGAIMLGSYAIIRVSISLWDLNVLLVKIVAETVLFAVSFFVQRAIFRNGQLRPKGAARALDLCRRITGSEQYGGEQ